MAPSMPNSYQLQGSGLFVSYTTSGIDGKPHFDYHDAHIVLHFTGEEIRTADLEFGMLVTVTISQTPDVGSTLFTLLVPHVNLDQTQPAHITTRGVTTIQRSSLVPARDHGQTDLYSITSLTGTARLVMF